MELGEGGDPEVHLWLIFPLFWGPAGRGGVQNLLGLRMEKMFETDVDKRLGIVYRAMGVNVEAPSQLNACNPSGPHASTESQRENGDQATLGPWRTVCVCGCRIHVAPWQSVPYFQWHSSMEWSLQIPSHQSMGGCLENTLIPLLINMGVFPSKGEESPLKPGTAPH